MRKTLLILAITEIIYSFYLPLTFIALSIGRNAG